MILEAMYVVLVFLGGSALMRIAGVRGWPLPILGFIVGFCIFIIISMLQIATPLDSNPITALSLTFILPAGYWLYLLIKKRDVGVGLLPVVVSISLICLAVFAAHNISLVSWSTDSFFYSEGAGLIARNQYEAAGLNIINKRALSIPVIHSLAQVSGELYLRSFGLLLGVSALMSFVWAFKEIAQKYMNRNRLIMFISLGLLLLLTNNRFIFHALYVNGHLLFAILLLLIVSAAWLMISRPDIPQKPLRLLQLLAVSALIVTRPDAAIVAGVALLPFLLSEKIDIRYRSILLAVMGATLLLWQGIAALIYFDRGLSLNTNIMGYLGLGVATILAIPLLRIEYLRSFLRKYHDQTLWVAEFGLWAALAWLTYSNPAIFSKMLHATIENVVFNEGSWGASLIILIAILVGLLIFRRFQNQIYIRFAVTTFFPLGFLFGYLKGTGYRVGDGDSLNRMLIHIVPLLVLYIILATAIGEKTHTKEDSFKLSKSSNPVQ